MPDLQGMTSETAVGFLERQQLAGLAERYWEKYLSHMPLLQLFRTKTHASRKMLVQTFINILITGELTSRPEAGRRIDPAMMERLVIEPFFDQYIIDMEGDQVLSLSNPADYENNSILVQTLEDALQYLRRGLATAVQTYLRTLHLWVCQILSTPGGATKTVSGVPTSIDWRFGTALYDADWNLPATDILSEFGRAKRKFRKLSGGFDPNVFIMNDAFHSQFILKNDELRDSFLIRHPEIMRGVVSSLQLPLPANEVSPERVIRVSDVYVDESSTPATGTDDDHVQQWPLNILTMAYVDPEDDNFVLNTCRTLDNEMEGGTYTRFFRQHNPEKAFVRFSGNYAPSFAEPRRIMMFKVSETTTADLPADIP